MFFNLTPETNFAIAEGDNNYGTEVEINRMIGEGWELVDFKFGELRFGNPVCYAAMKRKEKTND